MQTAQEILSLLAQKTLQTKIVKIDTMPASASPRQYFRLIDENGNALIGVEGTDDLENKTFIELANWFIQKTLNVPKIVANSATQKYYLQEDLGNDTLYALAQKYWLDSPNFTTKSNDDAPQFPEVLYQKYQQVILELIRWQTHGTADFDFSKCQPIQSFDERAIQWDFNYFKYYFAKLCGENFDETALQNDFDALAQFLMQAPAQYFMHRDFQSRNIIFNQNKPYFIDFQSGRKGPLYYDLASLLYQSSIQMPQLTREQLFDFYITELKKTQEIDAQAQAFFYGFVTARLLQVLGAYGFRGLLEKKAYFLKSIPQALENIGFLFENNKIPLALPELQRLFEKLKQSNWAEKFAIHLPSNTLTVSIHSFSYLKKGIPFDLSGNGGGFVFDCRAIHNPGRYDAYKNQTGKEQSVIDFLENDGEIQPFLQHASQLVEDTIEQYQKRNFQHLQVAFGCTGGQHRSVYCAEKLFEQLNKKYTLNLRLSHDEQHIYKNN